MQGGYGALFADQVQVLRVIRVTRYKFDRSREFIPGYNVIGGHWHDRGIRNYESVLRAGAKAKSVTNNLPLLSVLYAGIHLNPELSRGQWIINRFRLLS